MIRLFLLPSLFVTSQGFSQEVNLKYFNLSQEKIASEGSIVFYSDSLSNINSEEYLAIEGWNYDTESKDHNYFCFIKIGEKVQKLESTRRSKEESKTKSIYKNNDITVIIETAYLRKSKDESYFVKDHL